MNVVASRITPGCPVRTTLEMLGGKWRLLLLQELVGTPRRFGELRQLVPDISDKVLMQEIRQLVAAELVKRTPSAGTSSRAVYQLTPIGQQALPVLAAVAGFGLAYAAYIRAGRPTSDGETNQ